MATARRNDPCPCGSGLRFKECHGKLDGAASSTPDPQSLIPQALAAHQQGRIKDAERLYRQVLEVAPGHAVATHYLGMIAWHRDDPRRAEELMRASIAADANVPDFHNNLALLLGQQGRTQEAIAGFERALAVDPSWYEARNNLGLALEDALQWKAAEAAYREAIALSPTFAQAHQNLGRLLLALGRFAEAWDAYRWRHVARGFGATPAANAARLPANLDGRRFALVSEQGVGDVVFFLRFAPELAKRGARLAFRGDTRLHGMLARTGLFDLGLAPENARLDDLEPLFVGDLPWLLSANDVATLPAALPLSPLPERVSAMRERLEATGPHPWIALTWRAGVAPTGTARGQVKTFPIAGLGAALRGTSATWIGIQRRPESGTREAMEAALGTRVHDFSPWNEDLEDMLALLSLVDDYVGPSNANTHLLAGLGKTQRVLVPNPPEWRWMTGATESPWFHGSRVFRPSAAGDWAPAFSELAALLRR
ncbi:tetratricopeptide repeat protein [Usitatibacter palustris]|uniref:Uncharacterized protein n=1 Tax=Usitatibacter palustris TaxID=2732487 RepID=A0A6M4H9L0_9PROT|nr:tetratricopeptide repeat protein [Usitatibacter palustris]QJR15403.1 hypothetical protein DSM104440_02222 [Usitatibacter palustris]